MTNRRAVALLITLAALVLTAAGAASIAMHASSLSLARRADDQARRADDLAFAADAAILHWLRAKSGDVVLPPDASAPMVEIMSDAWRSGSDEYAVSITAWDQLGMVPFDSIKRASPLRLALDAEILSAIDAVNIDSEERFGLDQLAFRIDHPVFPARDVVSFGALVATHNPPFQSRRPEPVAINVNTAPVRLLEIAMRSEGVTDLELVLGERAEGRPAPAHQRADPSSSDENVPLLVGASDCWSVRVDTRVGMVRRSWWSVWTRQRSQWTLTQRLLIRERGDIPPGIQ